MIPFGDWQMPVSYPPGTLAEHKQVRTQVGLFDVSHMGEFRIKGPGATLALDRLIVSQASQIKIGFGQYTALCNPSGGTMDDLICYRLGEEEYFLCLNAGCAQKDVDWLLKGVGPALGQDESHLWGQLAVQGPQSTDLLARVFPQVQGIVYSQIVPLEGGGYLARTGYTGEKGYEIYVPWDQTPDLWDRLLALGAQPIGLGARDTLRLESCYLLYGQDMNETVSPLEAGIGWTVSLSKGDFVGRESLIQQKETGLKSQLQGFLMIDQGIPRPGMDVLFQGQKVGQVTSGGFLPTLGQGGGLALIETSLKLGDPVHILVRGQEKKAQIVKKPFYTPRIKS
jgi:aminomethyltransferase